MGNSGSGSAELRRAFSRPVAGGRGWAKTGSRIKEGGVRGGGNVGLARGEG